MPPPPVCQGLHLYLYIASSSCHQLICPLLLRLIDTLSFCQLWRQAKRSITPTPSTRRAATCTTSTCADPLHCPRASKLGFEPSHSGHNDGPGIDDHSCRHHCRHRTGEAKTTNNEEGAGCCYHVCGRRADKGREGQRSSCAGEASTHLKNLAPHSIFLAACDSLLGRG
jgi:hypothetical protein